MEPKKINLTAAPGVSVIHFLEGDAPKTTYPIKVSLNGDVNAVTDFLKTRGSITDKTKAIIVFNESGKQIRLDTEPALEDAGHIIKASLTEFEDLVNFGINKDKFFSLKELEKFVRMNRFWFADKDAHFNLTGQLKAFSAKVQTELQQEADLRGNKNNSFKKQVTSDLAADFILNIPIFKGLQSYTFRVEICYDVTDSMVRFWMESVELFELQKQATAQAFAPQLEAFKKEGFTVISQ